MRYYPEITVRWFTNVIIVYEMREDTISYNVTVNINGGPVETYVRSAENFDFLEPFVLYFREYGEAIILQED